MKCTPRSSASTVDDPGGRSTAFACNSANSSSNVFTRSDCGTLRRPAPRRSGGDRLVTAEWRQRDGDGRPRGLRRGLGCPSWSAETPPAAGGGGAVPPPPLPAGAPADDGTPTASGSPSASEDTCPPGALTTRTPGKLTIGTDNPAYAP